MCVSHTHFPHSCVCVCFLDHFCVCQTKEPFHTQSSIQTQSSAQKLYRDFISQCRNYFYANDIIRPMEFCCDGFGQIFLRFSLHQPVVKQCLMIWDQRFFQRSEVSLTSRRLNLCRSALLSDWISSEHVQLVFHTEINRNAIGNFFAWR